MVKAAFAAIVHLESPWTKDLSGRRNFLRLDASRRLIFCAQTNACRRTRTDADVHGRTQTDADWHGHRRTHADNADMCKIFQLHSLSKLLYVWALSLLPPHHSLPHVGSFSRSRNTVGTQSIVSETLPTNLQRSELAYSWGDTWFLNMSYWVVLAVWWSLSCVNSLHLTLSKVRLYGGRVAEAHGRMQTHANKHRCTQTHADEHKANCVRCVGGRNLKMRPGVRRLFKDLGTYYSNVIIT